ncbi:M20 family metallopeptidase [Arthrobacter sp. NPDC090010]|uniref:M20 family metallopeptidase n=1 Tax=Arthrobacter sp. NPDC090010 TaxID=3363942 RepID=UPI0038086BEA
MPSSAVLSDQLNASLAAARPAVLEMARYIHANPELSFEEVKAAAAITSLLEQHGFAVERGTGGLDTAFSASIGSGDLVVAICVEYDCLPEVGHACGHNLIAGSTVGAALALAPLVDELGITLKAIGTPAEEHGGGKSLLLDAGAFDGVGLSLMAHPGPEGRTSNPAGTSSQAVGRFRATFSGQAAHAAAMPHRGINAADGAVLSQVAVGLLRQQLPDDHRVALFVREAGVATNIIPDHAVVDFECRAFTLPEYEALLTRVRACFEGAALATGTGLDIQDIEPLYEPLVQDLQLSAHWNAAFGARGHDVTPAPDSSGGGSTDMGNISQVIPSIHPMFAIPGATLPIHSAGFTAAADTPEAYEAMFDAAFSLASTVADAASDPEQKARFTAAAYHPSSAEALA